MKGISRLRPQGLDDPLLVEVMRRGGHDDIPLWRHRPKETLGLMARWRELARVRDGPVNPHRVQIADLAATTAGIKALACAWGADLVGCAALTPMMIDCKADLPHANIVAFVVREDYGKVLAGPRAIEYEAMRVYVQCAEIATKLAAHIRDMGYPALAHHNGAGEIQAIPAMHAAGFGELGKHGSLIHPVYGASHRPGFVTTDLPLALGRPLEFGVQAYCETCNLCVSNCPGEAIPNDYELTEGIKRWVTDVAKCYPYSRLRAEYCHICVDVCPYVHKENGDPVLKQTYKRYMRKRKKAGYKAPALFPEDEETVHART